MIFLLYYIIIIFCFQLFIYQCKFILFLTMLPPIFVTSTHSSCVLYVYTVKFVVYRSKLLISNNVNFLILENTVLNSDTISAILIFFSELSWQNCIKTWLGSENICVFWRRLLRYLCITIPLNKT